MIIYKKYFYFLIFILFLFPGNIAAQMQLLEDDVLSEVSAQYGVSVQAQVDQGVLSVNADKISLGSLSQSLDLYNVAADIDISTFADDFHYFGIEINDTDNIGISLDVGSNKNTEPMDLYIGAISICNKDIGALSVSDIIWDNTRLEILPNQEIGINLSSALSIDEVNYKFNDTDSFSIGGINLSETASGNPENPDSWGFSGPITLSLSADTTNKVINMQMQGNIRVDNTPYGQMAIDGINIKYMEIRLK